MEGSDLERKKDTIALLLRKGRWVDVFGRRKFGTSGGSFLPYFHYEIDTELMSKDEEENIKGDTFAVGSRGRHQSDEPMQGSM